MRTLLIAVATAATALTAVMGAAAAPASVTLVELFTSEGCNSCPPADKYLHDLTTTDEAQLGETILLSWHVDYWDSLGWTDPFGLALASERQRAYAQTMKAARIQGAGVYTPQIIVDGASAFVGSDRRAGRTALGAGERNQTEHLRVELVHRDGMTTAAVMLPDLPDGATVMGVIAEDALTSKVTAGENMGKTLTHERVVRAAATAEITGQHATVKLAWPDGMDHANARVVVFAQAPNMGEILAVGQAPMAQESSTQPRYQTLTIGKLEMRYALILPDGFDPNRAYPVMLALPPGGQDESMVEAGLGRYWEAYAKAHGWIVVSPINPPFAKLFEAPSDPLPALMDEIAQRFKVKDDKFHLTGVSNGGRAAFLAALATPERFASLTVLPGMLAERTPTAKIKALKGLPIRMYVGGEDASWVAAANRTVETLDAQGIAAELTVLEGQGHVVDVDVASVFGALSGNERK